MVRALALAGGVLAGAAGSQFPEFSQQYVQRLGGAVDALGTVVADFDVSAAAAGLDRRAALAQLRGTAFLDRRGADMARSIARYDALRADLAALEGRGPFMRAYHAAALSDRDIAAATLRAFAPAVPLTISGAIFGGLGFLVGLLIARTVTMAARWPFRNRSPAR